MISVPSACLQSISFEENLINYSLISFIVEDVLVCGLGSPWHFESGQQEINQRKILFERQNLCFQYSQLIVLLNTKYNAIL